MDDDGWEDVTPPPPRRRKPIRVFPAAFPGRCAACDNAIREHEPIGYNPDDEICCELCLYDDERMERD